MSKPRLVSRSSGLYGATRKAVFNTASHAVISSRSNSASVGGGGEGGASAIRFPTEIIGPSSRKVDIQPLDRFLYTTTSRPFYAFSPQKSRKICTITLRFHPSVPSAILAARRYAGFIRPNQQSRNRKAATYPRNFASMKLPSVRTVGRRPTRRGVYRPGLSARFKLSKGAGKRGFAFRPFHRFCGARCAGAGSDRDLPDSRSLRRRRAGR